MRYYYLDGQDHTLIPLKWKGIPMDGYYICKRTARIFSMLTGSWPKPLSMPTEGNSKYPKVSFRYRGETITAQIHQVVAENLLPFPRPKSIAKDVWDSTCETVKNLIKLLHYVNHKDHNKYNWSLDNLEWTTPEGNSHAYLKHVGKW